MTIRVEDLDEADDPDEANDTECSDGLDDDADGWIDPDDPDCVDASDDAEDGALPGSSACHDGLDNDHDGLIDADGPACTTAAVDETTTATGTLTTMIPAARPGTTTASCTDGRYQYPCAVVIRSSSRWAGSIAWAAGAPGPVRTAIIASRRARTAGHSCLPHSRGWALGSVGSNRE